MNKDKIYKNEINYKTITGESEKNYKNEIKKILLKIIDQNKNEFFGNGDIDQRVKNIQINNKDYQNIDLYLSKLLECMDGRKLTYQNIKISLISSAKYKMVKSDTRYEKVAGWTVSIADFLKSIQTTLVKQVRSSKFDELAKEEQAKAEAKAKAEEEKLAKEEQAKAEASK